MKSQAKSGEAVPTEHMEQVTFVSWFRRTYEGVLIFAIPNGGFRHKATAERLKSEGVVSGIPDLHVPAWSLWVEMKRQKGGRLSPEQREKIAYLESNGHTCIVAKGAEDAMSQVRAFLARPGK